MSVKREKKSKKTTPKRTFVELNMKKSPPSIFFFSNLFSVFRETSNPASRSTGSGLGSIFLLKRKGLFSIFICFLFNEQGTPRNK